MLVKKNPESSKMLSISNLSFQSEAKRPTLTNFFKKWTYETNLTSPFAGLSGLKDNGVLMNNKYFYLNVISDLHIDSKVLPVFCVENKLSNYALKFLLCKDIESCINELISKKYDHFIGDLFNYLKDFRVIFKNINKTLEMSTPSSDPVYLIFKNMESIFCHKYDQAIEIMVNSNRSSMEE